MVVPSFVFVRLLRGLRRLSSSYPVSPELRGWCWDREPLRCRAFFGLGIYDVASYCPSRRDVWLRRVAGVRGSDVPSLRLGSDVHEVISLVVNGLRRCCYLDDLWSCSDVVDAVLRRFEGREWFCVLKDVAYITYHTLMSEYVWSRYGVGHQPLLELISEVRIDGPPLGLSPNLRVDALASGGLVIDFKVGKYHENHELALAGYALALEANLEVPIDYGFLVYIQPNGNGELKISVKGIYIDSDLRRDFIDARDEVIDMLVSGKEPPKPPTCHSTCPYRSYCLGDRS